jgi:NAD(P)-dependent dehydrogenase (short-subunit alcohol dehydrogenase family)
MGDKPWYRPLISKRQGATMRTPGARVALIAGANKGIGFEIARQIGKTGVRVLPGARDATLGEAAADPGFTATDLNGHRGYQTVPQGAAAAIHLALLPDDGPTGGFFSA